MSFQDASRLRTDDKNRHEDMAAHLNVCFRALDELGQSFENAKRTRDFLVSLQRRWQNHMRKTGSNTKRSLEAPATKNSQSTIDDSHFPGANTGIPTATVSSSSMPSIPGQKKPRLGDTSVPEESGLSVGFVDTHNLLPPNIDFGQIGSNALNWAPSSRELKMLSEEFGDAPLFSTTPSSSSTTSPRPPLPGGMTTMALTSVPTGGHNAVPSLDEIASAWWNWPSSGMPVADRINNTENNQRGDANL